MKKVYSGVLLFLLLAGSLLAQNHEQEHEAWVEINGLKDRLKIAEDDPSRIHLMNNISSKYFDIDKGDSCKIYAESALLLLNTISNVKPAFVKYTKLRAESLLSLGSALYYEDLNRAYDTLLIALRLWQETGDKSGLASTYLVLYYVSSAQNDHFEALNFLNKNLEINVEIDNQQNIGETWYYIGLEQRYLGRYGDALEGNINALKIANEIHDTTLITKALLANGFNYMFVDKYADAIKNQEEALAIFNHQNDSTGIATVYSDLGVTSNKAGKLDDALRYHKNALEIRKQLPDHTAIGISYEYASNILEEQGKFEEALTYNQEGLKNVLLGGDIRFVMDSYASAGDINLKLKNYKNALAHYNIVLNQSKQSNNKSSHANALVKISIVNRIMGNNRSAVASLREAEGLVPANDYITRRSIYEEMSTSLIAMNDYKNAFESQLKYQQMKDSVASAEKLVKITSMTQQLVFENKLALQKASQDNQLALQQTQINKQKLMRNISIAGLFVVIMFAFALFKRFTEKRKLNVALEKSIDNLKETQSQLIQAEKMASLGELTAGIAHEIQNPLNFVNNFSDVSTELIDEMIEEIHSGNQEDALEVAGYVRVNLEKITFHGKRADSIVKGMLLHSRKNTEEKELTDINELADEYLRLAYHGLRAKDKTFNATLNTDFDSAIGLINIIPQDIGRVLLNLITNAFYVVAEKKKIETSDYKPTVSVSTKKVGDKIEISVKDNGNGVPKEIIDKIFQPFFTTKPTGEGTGLGLSLSYDIVKAHGGTLKVQTQQSVATTFIIELPFQR